MSLYKRKDSDVWWCSYTDANGKRVRKSTRMTKKTDANDVLAEWTRAEARKRAGIVSVTDERIAKQATVGILSHLDDWHASMLAKGNKQASADKLKQRVVRIIESAGWQQLADITPEQLEAFCNELQQGGRYKNSPKRSAGTVKNYITAAKAFTSWLVKNRRLRDNPFIAVTKPNTEANRSLERRTLLPNEWSWLQRTMLEINAKRYGMPASERAIVYELAIQTGLRSVEIRSLKVHQFSLTGTQPYVSLRAADAKSKKKADQRILPPLAAKLRKLFSDQSRTARQSAFKLCSETNMARMARADLVAARKAYEAFCLEMGDLLGREALDTDFLEVENYEGHKFDFHAFRHSCGAWLALRGVHPKTIQTIMRHSTIVLTMDTYGHLMPGQVDEAVDSLGQFFDLKAATAANPCSHKQAIDSLIADL